jgi:uncharacterized membrane protein SpoIIM required for sporulation
MEPAKLSDLEGLFKNAVSAVIALAGIVLFIMLVMGGVKYITSGGDPKATEGAKHTITYAIGGLVLILLSYLILVILGKITGANITQFKIGGGP